MFLSKTAFEGHFRLQFRIYSAFDLKELKMEAMKKFWMTEDLIEHLLPIWPPSLSLSLCAKDLVEHLLPMLDLPSTLAVVSITFTFNMPHNSIWSLSLRNP